MIKVTIDKLDTTASELSAFDNSTECADIVSTLLNQGRKWAVSTQVMESGATVPPDAAVEAIQFAINTEDGLTFLNLWLHGDFDVIRKEWPECSSVVFLGADNAACSYCGAIHEPHQNILCSN